MLVGGLVIISLTVDRRIGWCPLDDPSFKPVGGKSEVVESIGLFERAEKQLNVGTRLAIGRPDRLFSNQRSDERECELNCRFLKFGPSPKRWVSDTPSVAQSCRRCLLRSKVQFAAVSLAISDPSNRGLSAGETEVVIPSHWG